MRTVTRPVFYCEHCKRHRLTKNSIERHEPRCIYNPRREACGWHGNPLFRPAYAEVYAPLLQRGDLDVDALREQMDGCPACMLAVVIQADLSWDERDDLGFSYTAEVERFRAAEREENPLW